MDEKLAKMALYLYSRVWFYIKYSMEISALGILATFWVLAPVNVIVYPLFFLTTDLWFYDVLYCLQYICLAYFTWDWPNKGGYPMDFFRCGRPWTQIREYFSHKIVKTADLDPERNYIIGSHPHGLLAIGGTLTFAAKVSGFNDLYPGMQQSILTLWGQFRWPWKREACMLVGANAVTPESFEYLMHNPGKGRVLGHVIGGVSEALMARPGKYDLKLKGRKGFVRQALIHGADLVPCYHFGEIQVFEHWTGINEQYVKNMQARFRNILGFFPPLLKGKSIFGFPTGGLMPFRRPITSVIGAPIRVERTETPTEEQIDDIHRQYCAVLFKLFEENKHLHNIPEDVHLNLY